MALRTAAVAAALQVLLTFTGGPAYAQVTAITGPAVIDGTGRAPIKDAVVLIEDNRIAAVGTRADVPIPAGARRIDAAGKFVIPGLMDANVHLMLNMSIEFIVRYEGRYEELIEEAAQISLKNGLTTVFDSWGPLQPLMNVRDRIARGQTIGSRLYVAGNIVGFTGPFGRDFNGAAETTVTRALFKRISALWEENTGPDLMYLTPELLRPEIRKYIARGIDFLKYGASGHRDEEFLMFSPEAQKVIIDECRRAGIIVQTHTTNVEALRIVTEAGVDMLQHASWTGPVPIPESTIRLILDKKIYAAVQPRTTQRLAYDVSQAESGPNPRRRGKERLQTMHENEVKLIKAGVPLLLATDAGPIDPDRAEAMSPAAQAQRPTAWGNAHFLWLEAMVEKGMKPMDALVAGTRNIAAAYKRLDQIGTLEKGKLADLLILDADPLADISNARRISTVIKDGKVVDRDRLPLKRVLSAPRGSGGDRHVEGPSLRVP